ncbi:flagellar hook-associated protein FlgL [Pseudomonas fluorescens]|uniref:Flagellar hook-associated protein 3 n=2 Tax=Pseudomonas fluorescens group TaxID=136843 RepID=A0ABS9F104_9PSED|nr:MULTISPECIES: flagellar hook-associated protein 3 [Pseudomonas fluorescens group]AIG05437.1 flagellar hook protein FlgL [Pseudomonas fluorescens]MCF4980269.1 flagellar hook-associated protein 3 [Pseudomonas gessardii]MCF4990192.1 flagellar hook-associated protein 3 [Pseudomonas gessardii]MCF5085937.1 flagellar hook-associated protein 3 [Pseudomonas gessardii]MCF5094072.1 flagellar hook-associated protein 3 [Pseudomonas gessardii]
MRISTEQYFNTTTARYTNNFSNVTKTQQQIDSGVRIQTAADDPVGAARLLLLQQQQDMLGQYAGNIGSMKNSLNSEESVLASIDTALARAGELSLKVAGKGGGGISDDDRKAVAAEIGEIEKQVLSLLNSKDSSGHYLFAGGKSDTPPYARNSDGTYSYQGDETPLSLKVSDTLSMVVNDTGKSILEGTVNAGRTQATGSVNDGKVLVSGGIVTSPSTYDSSFTDGQPYKLTFLSSTEYTVKDAAGNDITAQTPGNGKFDATKEGSSSVTVRGVTFDIDQNLAGAKPGAEADAVYKDREFTLQSKPDSFSVSRTASNASSAQLSGGTVTSQADYSSTFPNKGAVIKFTSGTAYEVYAQPISADSKPISTGNVVPGTPAQPGPPPVPATPDTITAAGVTLSITGAPGNGDQFAVGSNTHKTQNALDTLSQLRQALETPSDGDPIAQAKLTDVVNAAITNIKASQAQVDGVRGSIGARLNSLAIQETENTSMVLANKSTTSAIGDTDVATASIDLAFQKAMLEASQLAFVKISQLSLFSRM